MHHSDFIAILAQVYEPNVYLELGTCRGITFNKVKPYVKRAVGVDVFASYFYDLVSGEIYCETTESFFNHFTDKVDMIFIDADHAFEMVKFDFYNALKLLNPRGIILLHDTNPASMDLVNPGYCNDGYKIVEILEKDETLNIVTLPVMEAGLSMITRKNQLRIYE